MYKIRKMLKFEKNIIFRKTLKFVHFKENRAVQKKRSEKTARKPTEKNLQKRTGKNEKNKENG